MGVRSPSNISGTFCSTSPPAWYKFPVWFRRPYMRTSSRSCYRLQSRICLDGNSPDFRSKIQTWRFRTQLCLSNIIGPPPLWSQSAWWTLSGVGQCYGRETTFKFKRTTMWISITLIATIPCSRWMWWWGNSWHHKCNSSSVVGNPSPRYLPICLPYILECSSVGTPCYSDMECIPENPPPDVIVAGNNSSFPMHSTVKNSASSRLGIILYVTGLPTYSVMSYNFFMCKTTPLSMPEVPCNFRSPCRQVSRKGGFTTVKYTTTTTG